MNLANRSFELRSGITLKNRLFMAPLSTSSATETGGLSDEEIQFFARRSEGFGAVVIGSNSVSPVGNGFENSWNIYREENFDAYRRLATALQSKGVKVFLQIYHAGRLALPAFINGAQALAPSRIPPERGFSSYPRAMTEADIEQVIEEFQQGTLRAIELGFDGVEVHGANDYLLQQFLSPQSNQRADEWGGSLENRMKFPKKVIETCLAVIDQHATRPFALGYRFLAEEYETPGLRIDETMAFLKEISQLPLDYLHTSLNHYKGTSVHDEELIFPRLQESIQSDIPLIANGGISRLNDVNEVMQYAPLLSAANVCLINIDWAEQILTGTNHIRSEIKMNEQHDLKIPDSLWQVMLQIPGLIEN